MGRGRGGCVTGRSRLGGEGLGVAPPNDARLPGLYEFGPVERFNAAEEENPPVGMGRSVGVVGRETGDGSESPVAPVDKPEPERRDCGRGIRPLVLFISEV
jgi:hypothetical protein